MVYDMIYLLTVIVLTAGDSSTVQHLQTNSTQNNTINELGRMQAVPRLCELYPDICLTTEGKARI